MIFKKKISIKKDGVSVDGEYYIDKGLITVEGFYKDNYFKKTTQLGGHASIPENLARLMLSEVIKSEI